MGLFFLAGSFSVLLPLSTFTWQIEQADWNQRFCASLLFQAEFLSKWKVWQNTDCTSKEYAFGSK